MSGNWSKRTTNFKPDKLVALDKAARDQGYANLHHTMRSLTLSLLRENPTTA